MRNILFNSLLVLCLGVFPMIRISAQNTKVEILTDSGKIVVMLYDQTPKHKSNFLKVIGEGYYEQAIFHRIIKDFMVQGGENIDPKASQKYKDLVTAEIIDTIPNKRGALCAARTSDQVNPGRMSSPLQFYIVQGKKFADNQLNSVENSINQNNFQLKAQMVYRNISDSLKLVKINLPDSVIADMAVKRTKELFTLFHFTPKNREIYKTIGGAPHLDAQYTVFGEVVEGMEVVDKLASVPVGTGNRPLNPLKMKLKVLKN